MFDVADDIIGWLLRPDTLELRDSAVDLGVAILLRRGPGVTESRLFARTVRIIVCDASSTDADVAARSLRHLVAVGDVLLTECSFSDTSVDFVKRARSAFCRAALQWEVHATPGGRHFLDAVATEVPGLLLAAHVQYCRSAPASRIPDNFMRGTVQRSMACPLCKQEVSADSPESFEVLHLDMPERAVRHSLGDLLGLFFFRDRPFEEPYACSGCLGRALEAKAGARSTSVLSVPPTVLILDIKRYVENYAADADDAYVSYAELRPDALRFPLVLDLGPYASSRESCVYDLYATANYSGAGEVGHYVAYTLGLHPAFSSWSLSNDCVPTAATTADVLGAAAGYVTQLCYFRRETPKAGVVDLTEDDDPAGGAAGGAGGGAGAAVCFLDDDDDL